MLASAKNSELIRDVSEFMCWALYRAQHMNLSENLSRAFYGAVDLVVYEAAAREVFETVEGAHPVHPNLNKFLQGQGG
jgi:hypothetical protein